MSCCRQTGYRFVYDKRDKEALSAVVFRCDCPRGRSKLSVGIPIWDPSLTSRYSFEPVHLPKETTPDAQKGPSEPPKPEVKPQVLSESEKAFLKGLRASKEWGHPRLKDLIGIYGTEAVKAAIMGRV
jgi:hypothetical protein